MRKSRLSSYKQNRLIELFVAGATARTASALVRVNKTTASYYFLRLRQLIYDNSEHLEMFSGEVEADESYFGGTRKGKRGRGAAGKIPVFGLLKRNGKVYTVIISNAKSETLLPLIRESMPRQYCLHRLISWLQCSRCTNSSIIASTTVNYLRTNLITLMV